MTQFPGRVALQQRVFPAYRAAFFEHLAGRCIGGLSLFAGEALPGEGIAASVGLEHVHHVKARNLHLFDPSSRYYYCWQTGIVRWLECWKPDALIIEANPRYLSTSRAVRWMHAHGRPVLGWGLGASPLEGWLSSWRKRARQGFLASLDGLLAYSRRGAQEYAALGIPRERIFTALNAVEGAPPAPSPERPPLLDGKPMVLFVGRLQARKRVDLLLRACAGLPDALQPELVLVGDGPERSVLEKLAGHTYPQAQFSGEKRGAELESLFARADLFALPGTGGLAVQQAMRWGLPVIAAEGDGTLDDLVRPENGWRVPSGDLPALKRTLESALQDIPRLRRMGQASFGIIKEEVNIDRMMDVFIQALNATRERVKH